uniref:NADH-ubiquinone oxidoreductase chain 6 n=1 Tax=Symplecta hybrida TaxID=1807361 RepID=A0A192U6G0_9DIPT|nr:NADH dehydrogenase subunit 6 [Symplecta hybrida]AMN09065.1 NADH dehydrogenase subunit 6 [Symplecta hybrida]
MMHFFLIICSLVISFIFMQMKHPLAMGMILLMQTFLICVITGLMVKTFWFSYTLFLIFLGGMLVLFIYVTSLASNEMFSFSMNLFFMSLMIIGSFILMLLITDSSIISTFLMNSEMLFNTFSDNLIKENSINLNKLYNFPTNLVTLLLINYLLLTLIVIVKITNNFMGPLRPMN